MRNILFVILMFSFSLINAQSGITWSVPVDVAMSMYNNQHPRVSLDGNGNPLILWGNNMANEANFSRWNGTGFTMPMPLNPGSMPVFAESWAGPDLASKGDTVYVIFKQTPEDTSHIYLIYSYDGGITFSSPDTIDSIPGYQSRFPTVGTDAQGNPLVAFMKFEPGFSNPQYVVVGSNDFGNTFSTDVQSSGFSGGVVCDCCPASIVASQDYVVNLYRDNVNNIRNIWAGVSVDSGLTFPSGLQMDQSNWFNNSCPSSGPDGVIIGDSIYSVFMSEGTGNTLAYFSSSSLTTLQPGTDIALTGQFAGLADQNYPRIASSENAVAIAWRQTINNTNQINLLFTNNILNGLPPMYDTIAAGGQLINVDVALAPGIIHMVWEDGSAGTVKYRKGTFTSTGIISRNSDLFNLYPNPASDQLNVTTDKTELNIVKITLIDLSGKIMDEVIFDKSRFISITLSQPPGMYIIQLTDAFGKVHYSKLVIQ